MTLSIADIIERNEAMLLDAWLELQPGVEELRTDLVGQRERRDRSSTFLGALRRALEEAPDALEATAWEDVRALLGEISRAWAQKGVSPSETSHFVLSFKQPLFEHIANERALSRQELIELTWSASRTLDKLGLYVVEAALDAREKIIERQREEVLELSTPVVEVWDGILALPVIGVLDSMRTQQVMEALLSRVVETQAAYAIVDITGVPAVDSVTAQHLVKTATAARFMGARCIISGIRPQIAQTMVTLGLDFGDLETHSTLAGALAWALAQKGSSVGGSAP
jgi:rsbT co-antagonist protein RsbR